MAKTKIGGQAVLEGVMMRGKTSAALAVRESGGEILLETQRLPKATKIKQIPFIRGIVNMGVNFVDGMKYTTRSAELWGEDEVVEDSKKSSRQIAVATGAGIVLGVVLAVALFIFLPEYLTKMIFNLISGRVRAQSLGGFFTTLFAEYPDKPVFLWNLTAGVIKISIFVIYLWLVTLMKEIKRLFMYHGAEHRTINCYEKGLPLTVENVQKCSTYHDRCGTAFMFFVILIAILTMSIAEIWLTGLTTLQKGLLRILLLLPVVSLSYELIMFNARHDWFFLKPLKWLGRAMQTLSTKKPDDSMAEVAITAFTKVLEMETDQSIKGCAYPKTSTIVEYKESARQRLEANGITDFAAVEWIIAHILNKKRIEIKDEMGIGCSIQLRCDRLVNRFAAGEPLQYILGTQQFFDYEFEVNRGVLIPRPETEYLTAEIMNHLKGGERILDLCCGSGAIGITISLKTGAEVVCADVSDEAVATAKKNAEKYNCRAEIIKSDMFKEVKGKFDVIISNPPYIKSADIDSLDKNVKDFEPLCALDGGKDGLDFYRIIARESIHFLNKNGTLYLETGIGQANEVKELLKGFKSVKIFDDQYGIPRIVVAET